MHDAVSPEDSATLSRRELSEFPSRTAQEINKEQVLLLYRPTLSAAIATVFAAGILALLQWPAIDHQIILVWLACVALGISARVASYLIFFRVERGRDEVKVWEDLSVLIAFFSALTWGAAGVFLLPAGDFERQAGTILILAGMASGAVTTLSALRRPVFIFIPVAMLPLTAHLFMIGTGAAVPIAFMCLVYTIFLLGSANYTHRAHLENITRRIRSREEERTIRRSKETLRQTSNILQMIATGEPASDIYDAIARLYESRHAGLRCSMLILKGDTLFHGGAPSLPEEYRKAVDGLVYGPNVGSCGTSTFTGARVLVEDIATDPKWTALKEVALPHGLRSCWSEPIKDSTGKVLGAFGMYYNHPALPNEEESADLVSAARLAGIVLEREQREAQLVKLSNSLAQSGEAVIITDALGAIEYVNPAFTRMTGYSAEEALGRHPDFLNSRDKTHGFPPSPWEAMAKGESWANKMTSRRKDGSSYPAHLTVSPVRGANGEIINFIGVQSDLSDLQQLEEQLQQAQKMEAIGTLVGGIAHDFNNTLAGITGNLHLAKSAAVGSPKVVGKLVLAEKLAFRAAETIQQLLSFTRKGVVQKHPLRIAPFLREALKLLKASIPESINLTVEIPDSSLVINGDVNQLQQALMNLINNARDAVARVVNPAISIRLRRFSPDPDYLAKHSYLTGADYVCLCISDNGCGIAQQHRAHIFEPFYTTKPVGQGTGLGLSMVYGAVQSHDGHIVVDSAGVGQGAKFTIYLPLLPGAEAIAPEEGGDEIIRGDGETILLVDDNEIVLEIGVALLEELGYKVLTAKDGLDAVEKHRAEKDVIDLLLLDVVMPRMGGVEALRIIRQENPAVKVLFCTGYDRLDPEVEDVGVSHEAVIAKPFSINELSQKVRSALG